MSVGKIIVGESCQMSVSQMTLCHCCMSVGQMFIGTTSFFLMSVSQMCAGKMFVG